MKNVLFEQKKKIMK